MSRVSAGILLYRRLGDRLEVLCAHPGGPLHASRDLGAWTIPKGEVEPDEPLLAVALREFEEETGLRLDVGSSGVIALGSIRQKGGKLVHGWAIEGDLDPTTATSNTFTMEWPPRSGLRQEFPEIDRVAWFSLDDARRRLKEAQVPFLDRLEAAVAGPRHERQRPEVGAPGAPDG